MTALKETDHKTELTRPVTTPIPAVDLKVSGGISPASHQDQRTFAMSFRTTYVANNPLNAPSPGSSPALNQSIEDFKKSAFTRISGTDAYIQTGMKTIADTKKEVSGVDRPKYTRESDFDTDKLKEAFDSRKLKVGQYYPFVHHEGTYETGKLFSNQWSIDEKHLGVESEMAKEIHGYEKRSNMTLLGIRPLARADGWFAIFVKDNKTGDIMMGQFMTPAPEKRDGSHVIDLPKLAQELWKALPKVCDHYMPKR